jgi:hypothetical protein
VIKQIVAVGYYTVDGYPLRDGLRAAIGVNA